MNGRKSLKLNECFGVSDWRGVDLDKYEEFEERAAIMEYDGKLTREEAETRAAERLGLVQPSGYVEDTVDER